MKAKPIEYGVRIGRYIAIRDTQYDVDEIIRKYNLTAKRLIKDIRIEMYAGMPVQKAMERATYVCELPPDGPELADVAKTLDMRLVDSNGRRNHIQGVRKADSRRFDQGVSDKAEERKHRRIHNPCAGEQPIGMASFDCGGVCPHGRAVPR